MEDSAGDEAVNSSEPARSLLRNSADRQFQEPPSKRMKLDEGKLAVVADRPAFQKGVAPVKQEYLIFPPSSKGPEHTSQIDDEAAEAAQNRPPQGVQKKDRKDKKQKGQNKNRDFGSSRDALLLCPSRALQPEFSPLECKHGATCRFEHDLRKYLSHGKREDLKTFDGICPVWQVRGTCSAGWKCRFVGSHSKERDVDGQKELVLVEDPDRKAESGSKSTVESEIGVVNVVTTEQKIDLNRRRVKTPKSDAYLEWEANNSNKDGKQIDEFREGAPNGTRRGDDGENHDAAGENYNAVGDGRGKPNESSEITHETSNSRGDEDDEKTGSRIARSDHRAGFVDARLLPSEKRRIYYGPETPVLAPLTTQGNLPFRRLCVELGAQVTWSEMAMSLPLLQGARPEWALTKAHESEMSPPRFTGAGDVFNGYENSKDLKFGLQIAASKPWMAVKATEIVTAYCPYLRAVDLNCGCPIELVHRQGAGSALLDSPSKLEKILRGMNFVSGEVPITVKIRMGTRDNQPTAEKLINRLILGGPESRGPAGVAAITLHGRSRQQRYTRSADWSYISDCAALIQRLKQARDDKVDTSSEPDARDQSDDGKVYFLGNGDCFSHIDYYSHIQEAKVDSVMIARGALIKPWIFEEIESGMYLDKSASERLEYIRKFARYGLETWGSDEVGVGTTRRFLLEWLSFSCRYVPIGLLEYLPPRIQDRPPTFRGRNELETLLSSDNYRDWIKISEMFLGPAHPDFRFEPKHKSNSYDETEG